MKNQIVLGSFFGDEGKGATVQWLCKKAIEDNKKPIDYLSQKKKNIFINKIQGDIDNCELNDEYEDE